MLDTGRPTDRRADTDGMTAVRRDGDPGTARVEVPPALPALPAGPEDARRLIALLTKMHDKEQARAEDSTREARRATRRAS